MRLLLITSLAVSYFLTGPTYAEAESFQCIVKNVFAIEDDGDMIQDAEHLKSQIGSTFSVTRATGEIRGGYLINNEDSKTIEVINSPLENTFYVVSKSFGPIEMAGFLSIGNHRSSNTKPFVYTGAGSYWYSGFCQ